MKSELDRYILYADDDIDDQQTLKETLQEVAPEISLLTVENGIELIDFLNSLPPGSKFPCLILVDLNMPMANGIEILRSLKDHQEYKKLPVVIFSTADNHSWIETAKELGAEDFVKKPVNYDKLRQVTRQFANHCKLVPPAHV